MRIAPFAAAAALCSAAPALAQTAADACAGGECVAPAGGAAGGFSLSGEAAILSDYRFRGISRSDEDPALQVSATLSHGSGLYAGARGTTLAGTDSFRRRDPAFGTLGDLQLDLYVGYRRDLGRGFDLDAGLLYYIFAGDDGRDYAEPYATLSYLIGPIYASAGAKYAPPQHAIGGEDMLYLFGQMDVSVPFRPWRFSAVLGHQDWGGFGGYWTWSLGVEHQLRLDGLPEIGLGLRYVDTDLAAPGADAGLVLSIGLVF